MGRLVAVLLGTTFEGTPQKGPIVRKVRSDGLSNWLHELDIGQKYVNTLVSVLLSVSVSWNFVAQLQLDHVISTNNQDRVGITMMIKRAILL